MSNISYSQTIAPFTEEAQSRGVIYAMQNHLQVAGYLGFGCGFSDLDNDGDEDIIIIGAADGHVGIFENDGTGNFTDRSSGSGIPVLPEGAGFASADYDGDGLNDIYLTQVGLSNILAHNEGNFQFTDVTSTAGVGDTGPGQGPCFGDYDGDGLLDLYVPNYSSVILPPEQSTNNNLYHNLGNGTFEDVAVQQTVDDFGQGFQAVWSDTDRDGDLDLYLSNDNRSPGPYRTNQLWRNDNGQLVNFSQGSGADVQLYSMGIACGDFDGNGWTDFYCTNIPGGWGLNNPLLLNRGSGTSTFNESSSSAGVENPYTSWGAIFFDFDNNGHLDLYVNNMWDPNTLYSNSGTFPTQEIASTAGVVSNAQPSFGSAVGDVDNDGDLDLLVNNLGGNVELFINHEGEKRNWIRYKIVGQGNNKFAIGGNIDTRVGSTWQFREIYAGGNGYLGQNELTIHVGTDTAAVIDEAVVKWPGGATTRTLTNLPANHTWTVYPPESLGDSNGDHTVDLDDFVVFAGCYNIIFQPGCEMMDFNGDSAINMSDFTQFLTDYDDTPADCDNNGITDMEDILNDPSQDLNNNGVLDQCESGAECTEPTECDDSNMCTVDTCDTELGCLYDPVDCSDNNACTSDSCDSATGCLNNSIDCDDNNVCTTDSCDNLFGCVNTSISCDDGDACTTDSCNTQSGCVNDPVVCPQGELCVDGNCVPPVCGDNSCDTGEDQCICSADCGAPPSNENACSDQTDNDCDGLTDCDDPDCAEIFVCSCNVKREYCTSNADCCSNKCRGKPGNKKCK